MINMVARTEEIQIGSSKLNVADEVNTVRNNEKGKKT